MNSRRFSPLAILLVLSVLALAPSGAGQRLFGLNPFMDADTRIVEVGLSPFNPIVLGTAGLPALSGMDVQPGTGRLFISGGNTDGGRLHTMVPGFTTPTLVGPTGFPNVPGLAFDENGGLWGSAHVAGPTLNANGLISIDPVTGAATLVGAYGTVGGNDVRGVNCLAFHPDTQTLYGIANTAFNGNNGDLFSIDTTTGAATHLGTLAEAGTGANMPSTVAGLAYDAAGTLYGSLGGGNGHIVTIDVANLEFTIVGDAANGSMSDIAFVPDTVLVGINPVMDTVTNVVGVGIDPFTSQQLSTINMPALSGLDYQPATANLYASGGHSDGGNLYVITPSGTTQLIGATGFASVPGLAFDRDASLYGAAKVSGMPQSANGLISIDAATGTGTLIGTFGMANGSEIRGMNCIAIDPTDGALYGVTNNAFGGTQGGFFSIDKGTGAATLLGFLTDGGGASPPATVAGLTFNGSGRLFGSLGAGNGGIIEIDLGALTFTALGDAASGSMSDIAHFHLPAIDLGMGKVGGNGLVPQFGAIGDLFSGGSATFALTDAPPNTLLFMLLGPNILPKPFFGGTVVPDPVLPVGPFFSDGNGEFVFTLPGGGGFQVAVMQWIMFDAGASFGAGFSNAIVALFHP